MITGKNKGNFEQYCLVNFKWFSTLREFLEQPFEMQQGVYLAYYDSIGINIYVEWSLEVDWFYTVEVSMIGNGMGGYNSRNEAYKEAFKQADKLENEKLK